MVRILAIVLSLGFFSGSIAQAHITDPFFASYFTIDHHTTELVQEIQAVPTFADDDCRGPVADPAAIPGLEDLDNIIAVGEKLWKIIEAGRPVVSFKAPVVHALPMTITCWHELEKWQMPKSQLYEVVYKNKLGGKVATFRFRVTYASGGQVNGVGAYLANVTVQPAELRVSWGFDFDAEAEVGRTLNIGTHASPVAGIELMIRWRLKNVLTDVQASENFFVQGDGLLKRF